MTGLILNPISPRIESFNKDEGPTVKCSWSKVAEEKFLDYLESNEVKQRNEKKFWIEASAFLQKYGLKYSRDQCYFKWKNMKRINRVKLLTFFIFLKIGYSNFDKFNPFDFNKTNGNYPKVGEILGESIGKRKSDSGLIDDERSRPMKVTKVASGVDEVTHSKVEGKKVYTLIAENPKI